MATVLDLDVAPGGDETIENLDLKVRDRIARRNGTVLSYEPSGPGGGNPNYVVEVPDRDEAEALVNDLYGDEHDVVDTYIRS